MKSDLKWFDRRKSIFLSFVTTKISITETSFSPFPHLTRFCQICNNMHTEEKKSQLMQIVFYILNIYGLGVIQYRVLVFTYIFVQGEHISFLSPHGMHETTGPHTTSQSRNIWIYIYVLILAYFCLLSCQRMQIVQNSCNAPSEKSDLPLFCRIKTIYNNVYM